MTLEAELLRDQAIESEVRHRTRTLTAEVARLTRSEAEAFQTLEAMTQLEGVVRKPPRWTTSRGSHKAHTATVVAQLTDTHWDERVRPEEVGYLNSYSRAIAEIRFQTWAEKVIEIPREYFSGVKLEGLFIPATGDLLSGDIHAELKESNEDHLFSSADYWIDKLISALTLLSSEYPAVHVAAVVGNHGRSTVKPVFKGRARSNIEWLVWRSVARHFKEQENITFTVSDSMDLNVTIMGHNYLLTHGDQFRGGSGISGAMAPLMLGQHRKSVRQIAANLPMGHMVMGHYHQLLDLPGLIVGGSMKGIDEFAYGHNFRPEPAAQMLWLTTPERGKTLTMPIQLQDRKREGW